MPGNGELTPFAPWGRVRVWGIHARGAENQSQMDHHDPIWHLDAGLHIVRTFLGLSA